MSAKAHPRINIQVLNHEHQPIENASIEILPITDIKATSKSKAKPRLLKFKLQKMDQEEAFNRLEQSQARKVRIKVSAKGFETQERTLHFDEQGLEVPFILGKPKMKYYYSGKVKIPFNPKPEEICVVLRKEASPQAKGAYKRLLKKYGAEEKKLNSLNPKDPLFTILRIPGSRMKKKTGELRNALEKLSAVEGQGDVVTDHKGLVAMVQKLLFVKFEDEVVLDNINRLAKKYNLEILHQFPFMGELYVMQGKKKSGYALLDVCEKLGAEELVDWTQPEMIVEDELLFPPRDFFYPRQWIHNVIHTQDAWQILRNSAVNNTYGSPNIAIGVLDRGIRSITHAGTTRATHPSFMGNVTNGQSKVVAFQRFANVGGGVTNNDGISVDHGMMTASIATAMAENSPIINPGANQIEEGMAGIAPNCRLLAVIFKAVPLPSINMFLWTAGLNNKVSLVYSDPNIMPPVPAGGVPGIPALPAQAADVLNNSWRPGGFTGPVYTAVLPAIKYLTVFGRNGRGNVICFATGNDAILPLDPMHDYAKSEFTIAVGATSLDNNGNEDITDYSVRGAEMDVLAPSHFEYDVNLGNASSAIREHRPPNAHAPHQASFYGYARDLAGAALNTGALTTATTVAGNTIRIAGGRLFDPEQVVIIGGLGAAGARWNRVQDYQSLGGSFQYTLYQPVGAVFVVGTAVDAIDGYLPGGPGIMETTLRVAHAGAIPQLEINTASGFVPGQQLILGNIGDAHYQAVTISNTGIPSEQLVVLNANPAATPVGAPVRGITNISTNTTIAVEVNPGGGPPPPQAIIEVASVDGFLMGQNIIVDVPGTANNEIAEITNVNVATNELTLNPALNNNFPVGDPVHIIGGILTSELTTAVAAGDLVLNVESTARFHVGQALFIDNPASDTSEGHVIAQIVNSTSLRLVDPLYYNHPLPVLPNPRIQVVVGAPNYTGDGGGTSAASPVVAGIAALLLSANPNLTWQEVKHIIRETSTPLNLTQGGADRWNDKSGSSSNGGYGATNTTIGGAPGPLAVGTTDIPVVSAAGFFLRQGVRVGSGGNQERRVIMEIRLGVGGGPDVLVLDPTANVHNNGQTIQGGRLYYHSNKYGHGRVDAARAVAFAMNYTHDERDLLLRDYLREDAGGNLIQDNGLAVTNVMANDSKIQSPDIWVRNSNDPAAVPPTYDEDGPHENPDSGLREPVFTGAGADLNDLVVKGAYTGATNDPYHIEVLVPVGGVDQFRWRQGAGAWSGTTPMTVALTNLSTNIGIRFGATVGHTVGNTWTFDVLSGDCFLYLRVKNRGNGGPAFNPVQNLDAWARLYVAISDGATVAPSTTPFPFATHFHQGNPINHATQGIAMNAGVMETYFVGEEKFDEGTIAPGAQRIGKQTWTRPNLPPTSTNAFRTYLLGHVAPTDGPLNGSGPEENNNLTYREIIFAKNFLFNGGTTDEADYFIEVDGFGTILETEYDILTRIDYSTIRVEQLEYKFTLTNDDSTTLTATYAYTGGAWNINFPGAGGWLTIDPPVLAGAIATLDRVLIPVKVKTSRLQKNLRIEALIHSNDALASRVVISKEVKDILVLEQGQLPESLPEGTPALQPRSHVFADMATLTQSATQAYGPVQAALTDRFRTTSLFSAAANVNAYAVVAGIVFIQPGATANTVNLFLKPYKQAILGFTPVRYFVYRGLRKDDFINPGDVTKVVPQSPANSEFIASIWQTHIDLNGAVAPFESIALGYDPTNQLATDLVDSYFYRSDPDWQLPYVGKGKQLGVYIGGAGIDFGFEIMLEEGGEFQPDLTYARKASHEVDITVAPFTIDPFLKRVKREEILNFIDPAAFWGMHLTDKGYVEVENAGNKDKKKGQAIYTDIITKFHTRNQLYIDVRNDSASSYNFYGNYDNGSGVHMKLGITSGSQSNRSYTTSDWPIVIQSAAQNHSDDKNKVYIKLREDENKKPLLYVEHGDLITKATAGKFAADGRLEGGILSSYTKKIGFQFPNTGPANAKLNVAYLLKMHYTRQIDSNTTWPDEVVRIDRYTDNVFGPVDVEGFWAVDADTTIEWLSVQDRKYIDGSAQGFGQMVERGVAFDKNGTAERIIFYAAAVDRYINPTGFKPTNGVSAGVSKQGDLFDENFLFNAYQLYRDLIVDGGTNVNTLNFTLDPTVANPVPVEGMMVLGILRTERDVLLGLTGLSTAYQRNLHLVEETGSPFNSGGVSYRKYKVGLAGLKGDGKYDAVMPAGTVAEPHIIVYSLDGLFFFSAAFSAAQPIPGAYNRNYEEAIGLATKHISRTFAVAGVDAANKKITVDNQFVFSDLSEREEFTVDGNTYTVDSMVLKPVGGGASIHTEVTVNEAVPGSVATGDVVAYSLINWEDYFIQIDNQLAGTRMKTIVDGFVLDVSNTPFNPNATLGPLTTLVDNYGDQILQRARVLASDSSYAYADDRILYWARNKMMVALKGHPYCLSTISGRNTLVRRLDEVSRGYLDIDFSGVPAAVKKVLISGFDPFHLNPTKLENVEQSNPAGASALALHGQYMLDGANQVAYVQSVIFPVRYRDFEQDGGEGVVEQVFRKHVDPAAINYVAIDMAITLSQDITDDQFLVDRFASRFRGGGRDNLNLPAISRVATIPGKSQRLVNFKFPDAVPGDEFYEMNMPKDKIIPAANPVGSQFKVLLNNSFIYRYQDNNDWKESKSYPNNYNTFPDSRLYIEDPSHPEHGSLIGLVPSVLTGSTNPKKSEVESREGSGGKFLSNEAHYRVARLRATANPTLFSGHFHVPLIQSGTDAFKKGVTKDLIDLVAKLIKDAFL